MAHNKDGPHSTLGPDPKTGGFKPGFFARPGEAGLMMHHTQDRTNEHAAHQATAHRTRHTELGPITHFNGRTGGRPKAHVPVSPHLGMRSRTSPLPGMLTVNDVNGAPSEPQPNVLSPHTPSQQGKRQPPTYVHSGMTDQQRANARFNGEDVLHEGIAEAGPDHPVNMAKRFAASLPQSTEES